MTASLRESGTSIVISCQDIGDTPAGRPAPPGQEGRICASEKISRSFLSGADGVAGQDPTKNSLFVTDPPPRVASGCSAASLDVARSAPPGQEGLVARPWRESPEDFFHPVEQLLFDRLVIVLEGFAKLANQFLLLLRHLGRHHHINRHI